MHFLTRLHGLIIIKLTGSLVSLQHCVVYTLPGLLSDGLTTVVALARARAHNHMHTLLICMYSQPFQNELHNFICNRTHSVLAALCYTLPALLSDGLTVVVTPLLALMRDQLEKVHSKQIPGIS